MAVGYQRRVHHGGPGGHRVALLALLGWMAAAVLSVSPIHPSGHARGAAAVAEPPVRPGLDALVLAAAPLAYWPMQDGTPATAHDRLALHDATGQGAVRAGKAGPGTTTTSFRFDGSAAQVTASATGLAPAAVAATAWVRLPRTTPGGVGAVITTGGIDLSLYRGRVFGLTCATATVCSYVASRSTVNDGAWHQLALSVAQGTAVLYLDGVRVGARATTGAGAVPADGLVHIGRGVRGDIDNVALFAAPLTDSQVAAQFSAGACPQAADTLAPPTTTHVTPPALPLHTSGRWILDATGKRVKLAGINWYGAESLDRVPSGLQCQSLDGIASRMAGDGFNVVRLLWSTDTWVGTAGPGVPAIAVAANPQLRGASARQVFDAVVAALYRHGLLVILDNHVSRADWCCSTTDGNALWWEHYDPAHPPRWSGRTRTGKLRVFQAGQARWLSAWRHIAARYAPTGSHPQANVVGADLRNEPRPDLRLGLDIAWRAGKVAPWVDWPRAAEKAGNQLLGINPRLLVVVEGISFGTDLRGAGVRPVRLRVPHRLVYSAHDYVWDHASPGAVSADLGSRWGWLLIQHRWWTTPVWVGEYGTCHPEQAGCDQAAWFSALRGYLAAGDVDWAYWSFNGTGASAAPEPDTCATTPHLPGCDEGYGVSATTWADDSSPALSADLRALEPATQGP